MSSHVEQTLTLVLRIANAILEGRAHAERCMISLRAQGDQVSAELREAEAVFDVEPGDDALRRIVAARAAFCGQVAGERLVGAFATGGQSGVEDALPTFEATANALVRYVNEHANGEESVAVAAVEEACTLLPPDRRAMLSR